MYTIPISNPDLKFTEAKHTTTEEAEVSAIKRAVRPLRVFFHGFKDGALLFRPVDYVSNDRLDELMAEIEDALASANDPMIGDALRRWKINALAIIRDGDQMVEG
jgi:hypothetical protein